MSFRGWQKVSINTPNGIVEAIAPVIISASTTQRYAHINLKGLKQIIVFRILSRFASW